MRLIPFCFGHLIDTMESTALPLAGLMLVVSASHGQVPPRVPAVRCPRLIDVRTGIVANDVTVAFDNAGRVQTLTPGGPLPSGGVDVRQGTCLPGLIDAHTHLLQNFRPTLGDDANMVSTLATESTARRALMGAALAGDMLRSGFTTVRDLGNAGINGDADLRDAIAANWVVGPRMLVSTRALAPTGGQFGRLTSAGRMLVEQEYVEVATPEDVIRGVREAVYAGADLIKLIMNTGSRQLSVADVKAAVAEAARTRRKVAAHAIGDDVIRAAVEGGVASIEHAYSIPDDVLLEMARKGVFLVPTDWTAELNGLTYLPQTMQGEERAQRMKSYQQREADRTERLRKATGAGVKVAFGGDIYYDLPGLTRGEASIRVLEGYARAGLTPLQVIQTATTNAADLLGAADRVGAIEPGKWADIVVFDGDPLIDITTLRRPTLVIKGARVLWREAPR
jgi:imidazolonepropionase-like amidohydrolase